MARPSALAVFILMTNSKLVLDAIARCALGRDDTERGELLGSVENLAVLGDEHQLGNDQDCEDRTRRKFGVRRFLLRLAAGS